MVSGSVAVLVSSSDRTRDVFDRVFATFPAMWPDCPFPRFVGFTSGSGSSTPHGFMTVAAEGASSWRQELAEQITKLPAGVEYVILFLDDFLLLRKVRTEEVEAVVRLAIAERIPYTRLKAPERSFATSAWRKVRQALRPRQIVQLDRREPYYSSLQIALWRRDHLVRSLNEPGSIWEFEHQVLGEAMHHAVEKSVVHYRHLVERGEWRAYAPRLLQRAGVPFERGHRRLRPKADELVHIWHRLKFGLAGYTVMRLRGRAAARDKGASTLVSTRPVE